MARFCAWQVNILAVSVWLVLNDETHVQLLAELRMGLFYFENRSKGGVQMDSFLKSSLSVLQEYGVDPDKGLTAEMVRENRERFGWNSFTREKPISMVQRFFEASREPMVLLLIMAAVITLGVNVARAVGGGETDFVECAGIFIAILLSVVITVVMEGRSAKAFEALGRINDDIRVRVLRGGEFSLVPQREVVPGDIIFVSAGDKVPADGRLVESTSLMSDESSLT
ncbi:MAG: cation-transporting P-type ATPase, partial [Synergistaceae bacterium]